MDNNVLEYEKLAKEVSEYMYVEESNDEEELSEGLLGRIKKNLFNRIIGVIYIGLIIYDISTVVALLYSIRMLDLRTLGVNAWSFTIVSLLSIGTWVASTYSVYYNYYSRKFGGLIICVASIFLQLVGAFFSFFYSLFVPYVAKLTVTELMTEAKIAGLGWLVSVVPSFFLSLVLLIKVVRGIKMDENVTAIKNFKIKHHLPTRASEYDYTLRCVTDLATGSKVVIGEKARFLHSNIVGATGSAKTSSILLPAISNDLLVKITNEDAQKKAIEQMVKEGKAYIVKPFKDEDYSAAIINSGYVLPTPGNENEFDKRVKKYRSAGITVFGPDPSLADDVYNLTEAYKVKCNRIDPTRNDDGSLKPGNKGFNPLYISQLTEEWAYRKELVKRATMVADVMQTMFDMGGKSDPYFSSVNRIATTTACMVVMMVHSEVFHGETPTLKHVQRIINDFKYMNTYLTALRAYNKKHNDVYRPTVDIVTSQFLNNEKFEEHCTGLKIQFNNFLMHPDVERILCSEDSIDMDMLLRDGQVTVVNFELGDLGPVNSTCFGLYIMLSFVNAVLRRKGNEWSRLPHFKYVDELPLILCPQMEPCYTLYRKFKCSMTGAVQTMDQFDKSPFLKYMKGVVLSNCAHHFVYGRATLNDQEIFSALGGMTTKIKYTEGSSYNALTSTTPTLTMKGQYEKEEVERISKGKVRERDFQELTLFTVDEGRPLEPINGKTDFLRKEDKQPKKRYRVNWYELYLNQPYKITSKEEATAEEVSESITVDNVKVDNKPLPDIKPSENEYKQVTEISVFGEVASTLNEEYASSTQISVEEQTSDEGIKDIAKGADEADNDALEKNTNIPEKNDKVQNLAIDDNFILKYKDDCFISDILNGPKD